MKHKSHPKLRNGFGSIKYLGKGRLNPYAVYPPVKEFTEDGKAIMQPALGYVKTWEEGFAMLTAFHSGKYERGMEITLPDDASDETIMQYIMRVYTTKGRGMTFAQVYERFYEWKFTEDLSDSTRSLTEQSYRLCEPLHEVVFADLKHDDLQTFLNSLDKAKGTKGAVKALIKGMYKYAMINDIVKKDYSQYLKLTGAETKSGTAFSADEIRALWKKHDSLSEMALIMIYSGFRISEYQTLEINLADRYFKGGLKTKAGKGRIVPIHSAILPIVKKRIDEYGDLHFPERCYAYQTFKKLGHTPHDTRHTFSALCEKYHVPEADRKRLMGHSFGSDVTNGVYGHRTVEELRESIEMIRKDE